MNVEQIKIKIEAETGIPRGLLGGDTQEQIIANAKAIMAYKASLSAPPPRKKTTAEQFADWFSTRTGMRDASEFSLWADEQDF